MSPTTRCASLEVRDVTLRFGGVTALAGVSFEVRAGELLALIGPNGAGKTSILNCVSGLYRPQEGAIDLVESDGGRQPLQATMNRVPGPLYAIDHDGAVRNTYLLRVHAPGHQGELPLTATVLGLPGAELVMPPVELADDQALMVPVVVRLPAGAELPPSQAFRVELRTSTGRTAVDATFRTPRES